MTKQERGIYIAPKRGRLPRKYEVIGELSFQQKVRNVAIWLAIGAIFWLCVWLAWR